MSISVIGEKTLKLNGKEYLCRPAYCALEKAEALTGLGCLKMASLFHGGNAPIRVIAAVIYGSLYGASYPKFPELTYEEVKQAIYEGSVMNFTTPAAELLGKMLNGRGEEEVPAAEAEKKSTPSKRKSKTTLA